MKGIEIQRLGCRALQTTIIACECSGGVVLGADSRTSMGDFVANRVSDKIVPLCDNVYMLRSGSAADTQAVHRHVCQLVDEQSAARGQPGIIDVQTAANMVSQLSYTNKDLLQAGMIVAGWDRQRGGQVYAVPLGGTLLKLPLAMGGSGSNYVQSWADTQFKENMSFEKAEEFVSRAVMYAIARDGSSGGVVRLCSISSAGVRRRHAIQTESGFIKGLDELTEPSALH